MTLSDALALYDKHNAETDSIVLNAILAVFKENKATNVTVEHIEFVTLNNLFMCFCEIFFHYTQQTPPSIETLRQHNITRSGYGTSILKHHRPAIEALSDQEKIEFFLACDVKTRWRITKLTQKTPFEYNNTLEDNTLDDHSVRAVKILFGLPVTTCMALAHSTEMKTHLLKEIAGV